MKPFENASFIKNPYDTGTVSPCFTKKFVLGKVKKAALNISALGLYEAYVNGKPVTDTRFNPGWTVYEKRLQYQTYDITPLLQEGENELSVLLGRGWWAGRLAGWVFKESPNRDMQLIAEIAAEDENGTTVISTDESFTVSTSRILLSEYYDGETYDENAEIKVLGPAEKTGTAKDILIPQEGEEIREQEVLRPAVSFVTPRGERVIDFGQNMTGYVRFRAKGKPGEKVRYTHAEILDADGNFYTENMRSAENIIDYTIGEEPAVYSPHFSFQGFRYIRLEECPAAMCTDDFEAVVVHSDMKRKGRIESGSELLNRLFHNIIWGQKSNFLDVPTDCPQRDERLGWTGDAEVFCRAASYNYDTQKFFRKWLRDVAAAQDEKGRVPHVVPNVLGPDAVASAAWADCATIIPWEIYKIYGDKNDLAEQFSCMKKWVDYIHSVDKGEFLWTGYEHYGDWLGLDAPAGSYKGSTSEDYIASAYYAYSTERLIKAGKALGYDVSGYEELYANIVCAFRERFLPDGLPACDTQTAYVLALHFGLTDDKPRLAAILADKIHKNGDRLQTGFVGTPYLLHTLSDNGYADLAYTLLLQEAFPSWLYSVKLGATTMWEHWDGVNDKGEMWSADMNSFNHYAYGAVADWIYEKAAGIQPVEEAAGFKKVRIAPAPYEKLGYLRASVDTPYGEIVSEWRYEGGVPHYRISVPEGVCADICAGGREFTAGAGLYEF